jgi:Leucine-rich repeat (LRR) protein
MMFDVALFGTLGVNSLDLPDSTTLEAVESGDLRHIEEICLGDVKLGPKGAARLAALKLPALRRLDLTLTRLKPEGLALLAKASWARQLTALDLSAAKVGKAIAYIDAFPKLIDLRLSENDLRDGEVIELSAARCIPKLRRLDLASNRIGLAGVEALVGRLRVVEQLDLSGNALRDDSAAVLARARFPALTHLVMRVNRLTAAGESLLVDAFSAQRVI